MRPHADINVVLSTIERSTPAFSASNSLKKHKGYQVLILDSDKPVAEICRMRSVRRNISAFDIFVDDFLEGPRGSLYFCMASMMPWQYETMPGVGDPELTIGSIYLLRQFCDQRPRRRESWDTDSPIAPKMTTQPSRRH
jgi:hypothetical protein